MENFNQTPPHVCKYCGKPSWIDPSDQSPPPDYCLSSDHGRPPDREELSTGQIGFFEDWGIWVDIRGTKGWMKDIYGHPALFSEANAKSLCGAGKEGSYTAKKIRVIMEVIEEGEEDAKG